MILDPNFGPEVVRPDPEVLPPTDKEAVRAALTAVERKEVRPGRFRREATVFLYTLGRHVTFTAWAGRCPDCLVFYPEGFVLTDEVWESIAPLDGVLCLPCADARAVKVRGRRLEAEDFKQTVPAVNSGHLHLLTRDLPKEV